MVEENISAYYTNQSVKKKIEKFSLTRPVQSYIKYRINIEKTDLRHRITLLNATDKRLKICKI